MSRDKDAEILDLIMLDPEIDRLQKDDTILRSRSTEEGALGRNDSDYFHLWDLYNRVRERVVAMDSDPLAFLGPDGEPDRETLKVYAGLVSETRRMLETLNKMRNTDRVTAAILEQHTRSYAEALAIPLGEKLRVVLSALEKDTHQARAVVISLLQRGLVEIFRDAALSSLASTKETYNLN